MEILETRTSDVMTVTLRGRLDASSSGVVQDRLVHLIDSGEHCLIVDLGPLEYVSSVGVRVFLSVAKRLSALGGRIALCRPQATIRHVFDIAGFGDLAAFGRVLVICEGVDHAVAVLQ
jgi:anti-anti-sigma factor